MGLAALQRERPVRGRISCRLARVRVLSCGDFHYNGIPRVMGHLCELVCLFGWTSLPSTDRRDYGGPLLLCSGQEVFHTRPREKRLGSYKFLPKVLPLQPPPDSIPGDGEGAACYHEKVRFDAKGEERALPMGSAGLLRPSLRVTQLGLLPPGSGIHGGGDVWGDVQVQRR